jgi:molybdopterin converting factor small subunit
VTVTFWAGAQRAAGRRSELLAARTLGDVRAQLAGRAELAGLIAACSLLVDGARYDDDAPLPPAARVDVLPPFAGG